MSKVTKKSNFDLMPGGIVPRIHGIRRLFREILRVSLLREKTFAELAEMSSKLAVQQTIFESGARLVLSSAANRWRDVRDMLESHDHAFWNDHIINRTAEDMMARFSKLCLRVLQHIWESLEDFRVKLESLSKRDKNGTKAVYQLMHTLIPSRLRPSMTPVHVPGILEWLGECNDIFLTLSRQVVPGQFGHVVGLSSFSITELPSSERASTASTAAEFLQSHFFCIQRASQELHNTLSRIWSCREHSAHSLGISLDSSTLNAGRLAPGRAFRFNLVVTMPLNDEPFCLVIDCHQSKACSCGTSLADHLPQTSERGNPAMKTTSPACGRKPACQSKASTDALGRHVRWASSRTKLLWRSEENEIPDLAQEEDFCLHLRRTCYGRNGLRNGPKGSRLGYLKTQSSLGFLFFYVRRRATDRLDLCTLDDVLSRAKDRSTRLPVEDRLRFAARLATAMLQFHATPWFPYGWSSRDILFLDSEESRNSYQLDNPYLRDQLNNGVANHAVFEVASSSSTQSTLLSLGSVLLELAFSAPLRKLKLPGKIAIELVEWERDCLTIMKLIENVSRELGPTYAKVVRTCFSHGFGPQGLHSLGNLELDHIISNDVVKELDRCLSFVLAELGTLNNPPVLTLTDSSVGESIPASGSSAGYFNYPEYRIENFISREEALSTIRKCYLNHDINVLPKTVVLHGTAGCGKTQLALEYCRQTRKEEKYQAIFWIDASSLATIAQSFTSIAADLLSSRVNRNSAEANIETVLEAMRTWRTPWLLVFDDFDGHETLEQMSAFDLLKQSGSGNLLFTSTQDCAKSLGHNIIVSRLAPNEGLDLLFSRSQVKQNLENIANATKIIGKLEYLAIAIDLAGAYILASKIDFHKYLDEYDVCRGKLLRDNPRLRAYRHIGSERDYANFLKACTNCELSLTRLSGSRESRQSKQHLLILAAFLYGNNIPEGLFQTHHKSGNPYWSATSAYEGMQSSNNFENILMELRDLALVQSISDGASGLSFTVHPLVQHWMKLRIDDADCQKYIDEVAYALREYIASQSTIQGAASQSTMCHLQTFFENEQSSSIKKNIMRGDPFFSDFLRHSG